MGTKNSTENKFFNLVRPYLGFIDSPKFFTGPFSALYYLFALVYLLSPFFILYKIIEAGVFKSGDAKLIVFVILTWLAILAAGWISFQIWWNRQKTVETDKVTGDTVIEVLSGLVYTFIEASATYTGIAGFFWGIFALILNKGVLDYPVWFGLHAVPLVIGSILIGYFGVWLAKFIALLFRKILEIIFYVAVRVFRFVVHIVKQLFEYVFIFWQSVVDFVVNGWRVVVALVAKLGNALLTFAEEKPAPGSDKAAVYYNS